MELSIITPLKQHFYDITWLEINTATGNFVIQKGHAPMIIMLAPQQKFTFCLKNGKRESMAVKEGIAHITRSAATILINE